MLLHHLHIYVHSRGKRKVGECFNDFWSGIQDVDHSLVHTHLELFSRIFVHEGQAVKQWTSPATKI